MPHLLGAVHRYTRDAHWSSCALVQKKITSEWCFIYGKKPETCWTTLVVEYVPQNIADTKLFSIRKEDL